ncbi:MAG: HAD family hydrolase [Treponema sp.]|nr:HAD family hydrolase [Treponema sp.]
MRDDIKAVAFDLDGTLYPNRQVNFRLIPFALKEFALLSAFGKARRIIRQNQRENILPQGDFYEYQAEITAKILGVNPQQMKEKIDRLIYRGWEPLFKKVKLFRGMHETLEALNKAGCKLGLLSDFPPEAKLENLGLNKYWDTVQCSERCGALKPHPESFLRLAEALALPPENILYVGNSHAYDVTGAASIGMKTAWLKPLFKGGNKKSPKPDFSFNNYRQFNNFMLN